MNTLTLDLGAHSYALHIGTDLLDNIEAYIPLSLEKRKVFILTDETVKPLYADTIMSVFKAQGALPFLLCVKGGEESKSFSEFERLSHEILSHQVTRDSLLVALGGGVVGDLGGFLASTLLRGIPYIQVPTTLLAQVDSSVGGKTAINTPYGKNLVGTFYQPKSVIIDLNTLKTLPVREYRAGLAESVKYGLIEDVSFFEYLETNSARLNAMDMEVCQEIVLKSCETKARIVSQDEKETKGKRALLNLGHTFGHALETLAGYTGDVLHGEGVSVGMVMAAQASHELGMFSQEDVIRLTRLLRALALPVSIKDLGVSVTPTKMYTLMCGDKKATKDGIGFILLDKIGQARLRSDLSEEFILKLIEKCMELD